MQAMADGSFTESRVSLAYLALGSGGIFNRFSKQQNTGFDSAKASAFTDPLP